MRNQFAKTMIKLAEQDSKMVLLIGDISHHLLKEFEQRFPDRFFNLGIAEQALMSVAAGLAMNGMRPVVHTIAPFCVERAYEQIKDDLCYQNLDVTIISVGGSFDYAALGCTHHCYEDIAILRALPNMEVYIPGSPKEVDSLISTAWANGKPKYFKLTADKHLQDIDINAGEVKIFNNKGEGKQATVFVTGHLLEEVLKVNLDLHVVYVPTITPLSFKGHDEIELALLKNENVFVVEENSIVGGLGDMILAEASFQGYTPNIQKMGIPRRFLTNYGKAAQHREKLGFTAKSIEQWISLYV